MDTNPHATGRWHRFRWPLAILLLILFALVVGQAAQISRQNALEELQQRAQGDLNRYLLNLQQKLDRYKDLPSLLATHTTLQNVLRQPEDPEARRQASVYLAQVQATIEASDVYVMNRSGHTVAASNWMRLRSFIGRNFAFRPYFKDAIEGRPGRYFALGSTSRKRGYYFSYPVYEGDLVNGVVVVKIDLSEIESDWSDAERDILVTDEDGVIFISSRNDWKFRTLHPLQEKDMRRIVDSARYQDHELVALDIVHRRQLGEDSELITLMEGRRIESAALDGIEARQYLLQSRELDDTGLTVSLLASLKSVQSRMYNATVMSAAIFLLLLVLVAFLISRQRIQRERARFKQQRTAALEESEARIRAVIDNTWAGLITLDEQGRIDSFNTTAEKLFGYQQEQVRGQYFSMLFSRQDRPRCWEQIQAPEQQGEELLLEAQAQHCNRFLFPVELVIGQMEEGGRRRFILTVHDITERKRYEEQLQRAREELELRVEDRTRDLTRTNDRLRAEMDKHKDTQNQLIQTAKLALLGQMSAGINHELNQPLTAIRAYSENARTFLGMGKLETVEGNLTEIAGLTERMAKIIHPLKEFSRHTSGQPEPVCLKTVSDGAMSIMYGRLDKQGAQINWPQDLQRYYVMGDVVRLEQVVVNLISNALQAMEGLAQKQIDISLTEAEQGLSLQLRDHGPGIPEDELDMVFEPFYTTKKSGQGLGLGLSISHRIIISLNGTLTAANHPQGGAIFTMTLPRAECPQPNDIQETP